MSVRRSVLPHVREPIFAPIEIESDRDRRQASVRVGDVGEITIEPIKNPVTGEEHRVRIDLPDGFEYKQAEIGNTVELSETYGQLNQFNWSRDR